MARRPISTITVSDSEDEDEADIPSKEECERRSQSFSDVTGSDSALAMMFLQQHGWNLEPAVAKFFQNSDTEKKPLSVGSYDDKIETSNVPPKEECERRCTAFTDMTGSDSVLALKFLQENEWSIEAAIENFFQDSESKQFKKILKDTSKSKENLAVGNINNFRPSGSTSDSYLTLNPPVLQNSHASVIKVLSWNIDGLDPDNLQSRTEGTCSVLNQENAEVIFLQEVVERSLSIIKERMTKYHLYTGVEGRIMPNAYFTAMLLRKDCVQVESVKVIDFPSTKMSRNLLEVKADVQGKPLIFLTSHLESTAEHTTERKRQLKIGFSRMAAAPTDCTVVFGGDLNLRDKELTGESSKPQGVYDIWECTGKRPEAKNTWDLLKNDNKQLGGKFQPRCRFDRMYIKHSKPVQLKPVYFELVGLQRLASCRRFPSDHWGILAHLNILPGAK